MSQYNIHPSRPQKALCLVFLVGILAAGCRATLPPGDQEVLLDNSGSLRGDIPQAVGTRVVEKATAWAQAASPGSRFRVWIFNAADDYPAKEFTTYTMPTLRAPAFKHRKEYLDQVKSDLEHRIQHLPYHHRGSPVIEAIGFITHVRDLTPEKGYRLLVVSDLIQTSPRLEFTAQQLAAEKDPALLARMRGIAPTPLHPPDEVTLITYPGFVDKTPIRDTLHARICGLYEAFFTQWPIRQQAVARESIR